MIIGKILRKRMNDQRLVKNLKIVLEKHQKRVKMLTAFNESRKIKEQPPMDEEMAETRVRMGVVTRMIRRLED